MKRKIIINCIISFSFILQLYAQPANNAIFLGGRGDGWTSASNNIITSNSIYLGGQGDGWTSASNNIITSNSIYLGGQGDGWSSISNNAIANNIFSGGSGDGWSALFLPLGPLPLRFISFTVQKCNNNSVCLYWQTANEQNVNNFEIERSIDGNTFIKIGEEQAKNNTTNSYTSVDNISALLSKKLIYYRIKQIDIGGSFSYSNIQVVQIFTNGAVMVYPNPTNDVLHIRNFTLIKKVLLIDMNGRVLKEWEAGYPTISLKQFAAGIYIIKIMLNTGEISEQKINKF